MTDMTTAAILGQYARDLKEQGFEPNDIHLLVQAASAAVYSNGIVVGPIERTENVPNELYHAVVKANQALHALEGFIAAHQRKVAGE